ncbi:MAG: oligoendopeptidase F, partial [Clostridiales bacterium]|nr:oligoendopeptidase F [Clostridiales bacterium]
MSLSMRWQLDDLYASFEDKKFLDDLAALKTAIANLTAFAETAFADPGDAIAKLEKYISMENDLDRFQTLAYYCQLVMSVDALNEQAMKYGDVIDNLFTGLAKPDVLFKQFVSKIPDLDGVISKSPVLREHAFILHEVKAAAQYALSEKEEIVIATMATTGSSAWGTMKEQLFAITSEEIELGGIKQTLPMTAIRNLAYHNDPAARKSAYIAELQAYKKIDQPTAAALNGIKGEVLSLSKLRGYASPLDMTLL